MSIQKKEFSEYPFDLSTARTRYEAGAHRIKQKTKSIRLGQFSDQFVEIRIIFDLGDERTLRPGDVVVLDEAQGGFTCEWKIQSGKTVIVEVHETLAFLPLPVIQSTIAPSVGAGFTPNLQSVTVAPTLLIPANSTRTNCKIENRGTLTHYLGDLATLNDINYKLKAEILKVGSTGIWENLSGLYVRTEIGTDVNALYTLDQYK